MEPTKFENHIKNTLDKRKINPSEEAWHKIKEELGNDYMPEKRKYLRYGIAAGFIGFLLIAALFFWKDDKALEQEFQIVDKPLIPVIEPERVLPQDETDLVSEKAVTTVEKSVTEDKENRYEAPKSQSKYEMVLVEDTQEPIIENTQNNPDSDSDELFNAKIAEVMAQVNEMEGKDKELSDMEIDSLLRQAQREILAEKITNSDNSINPSALLSQVEEELDQSFRDQIFEKLKTGFVKVRTAVADRNN